MPRPAYMRNHLCSRTLSDTANMFSAWEHTVPPTVEKILCRSPAAVTYRQSAPDPSRERGFTRGWKPQVSPPVPPPVETLPLRFSENSPPVRGRTRLRQFRAPSQPVLKKEPPVREHAYAVRVPAQPVPKTACAVRIPRFPYAESRKGPLTRCLSPSVDMSAAPAAAVAAITAAAAGIITTGTRRNRSRRCPDRSIPRSG